MARWSSQTTHNDISDFSDNPHLRRELKFWRLKIAAVVLTVLAVIGFSIKPAYRAFRENRINKNLEAAKEAARLKDWGTARDRARSVLLAREGDFEAYRIWTRALGKMGEPRTYMVAASLFADPRSTDADKLECMKVLAWQAPQALALSAYASLSENLRDNVEFRAAISPLLVHRGEFAIAEKGLRDLSALQGSPTVRLELLRVLCGRATPENVAEARDIFSGLIREDASSEALEALRILGETKGGLAAGAPLPDLPEWLQRIPEATTLDHLLALHPEMDAKPESVEPLINSAIKRFQEVDPGILGTWLVRHGRAERASMLLEGSAKTRSDAYIARLNALLRLGRYKDLELALATYPDSTDLVEVEMIRATMAWQMGDRISSGTAWTKALNHAAFDPSRNRFIEIAQAAEKCGATEAAGDAWVAAIRVGWGRLPLYRDLLPVIVGIASRSRSEDLFAMTRTLLRFESMNSDLINNVQYLGLIQGVFTPDQVLRDLQNLLDHHPEMPEIHSAMMLAELMKGEPAEALKRLAAAKGSRRISPMMLDALEGSAQVLGGDTESGMALLRKVRWKQFMRQERIVFRDLLVELKISGLPLPEFEVDELTPDPELAPAWRKAVEEMERDRSADVLPALPAPRIPGSESDEFPPAEE